MPSPGRYSPFPLSMRVSHLSWLGEEVQFEDLGLGLRLAPLVIFAPDSFLDNRFSFLVPCPCAAEVTCPDRHNGLASQNAPVAPLKEIHLLAALDSAAASAVVAYFRGNLMWHPPMVAQKPAAGV